MNYTNKKFSIFEFNLILQLNLGIKLAYGMILWVISTHIIVMIQK